MAFTVTCSDVQESLGSLLEDWELAYILGNTSSERLNQAAPKLQEVVSYAISICECDFSVIETKRTEEQQRENIANKVSWTMDSYHLPDENNEVWAVDIYPWVNGETNHSQKYYNRIAKAMFRASQKYGVRLEWGGLWKKSQKDNPHWQIVGMVNQA